MTRVGLISDTHGLLRPQVFDAFAGVDRILHAGDIGDAGILTELETLAPVDAVWGNVDGFDVRARTRETVDVEVAGHRILVVHGHLFGSPTPQALLAAYPEADVIVFGHTHRPAVETVGGRLAVNPGASGPARFRLRPSVALLELSTSPQVQILEL